jgi:hypothetical protein
MAADLWQWIIGCCASFVVLGSVMPADGPGEIPTPICACGAPRHATDPGRCAKGHPLVGVPLHQTHGAYAYRARGEASLPPETRLSVADFKRQVLIDRGGRSDLSAIQIARIDRLAALETTLRLLENDIAVNGLFTKRGRIRSSYGYYLETHTAWERTATHVGDERRARPLPSLRDYLDGGTASTLEGQEAMRDGDRRRESKPDGDE